MISVEDTREWVENALRNFNRSDTTKLDDALNGLGSGLTTEEFIDSFRPKKSATPKKRNRTSITSTPHEALIQKTITKIGGYGHILSIEDAKDLGLHGGPGNGSGDRTVISKIFINTTIYGSSRDHMTYPKTYDEHIELSEIELNCIRDYKNKRRAGNGGKGVIGFIIHGKNEAELISRPIRQDIKKHFKNKNCVKCDATKTICDHKNDLYNDPRVLDTKTQKKEDFQPLCNSCNLRKRAVAIKRDKSLKRQPPSPDILSLNGGISFTEGSESYDTNDPNALVGTYWYDPIKFGRDCHKIIV